jgi:hypothetical protein
MATLFQDSFDHYATADLTEKWTQIIDDTGGNPTIGAWGRNGTNGLQLNIGGAGRANRLGLTVPVSGATAIVQFGFRSPSAFSNLDVGTSATSINESRVLSLRQGGTTQVWFRINTNGTISAYQGSTLLLTTDVALQQNVYQYLKFKTLIDNSAGTVAIDVNGVTKSATGLDTQVTGSATVDELVLGNLVGTGSQWQYDDFIVMDSTGSDYNDLIGDHRMLCCFVSAEGAHTDGTPSSGADRSLMVDETEADGDTTRNAKDTANQKDSFAIAGWPSTGLIGPIQVVGQARKEDEGAAQIALGVRVDGVDHDGTGQGLSTDYAMFREIFEEDPENTTAWAAGSPPELIDKKAT